VSDAAGHSPSPSPAGLPFGRTIRTDAQRHYDAAAAERWFASLADPHVRARILAGRPMPQPDAGEPRQGSLRSQLDAERADRARRRLRVQARRDRGREQREQIRPVGMTFTRALEIAIEARTRTEMGADPERIDLPSP